MLLTIINSFILLCYSCWLLLFFFFISCDKYSLTHIRKRFRVHGKFENVSSVLHHHNQKSKWNCTEIYVNLQYMHVSVFLSIFTFVLLVCWKSSPCVCVCMDGICLAHITLVIAFLNIYFFFFLILLHTFIHPPTKPNDRPFILITENLHSWCGYSW